MNIRIRQIGKKSATAGFHFNDSDPCARKLEPGEVVRVDEDSPYFAIFAKVLDRVDSPLEITTRPATRPLVYDSPKEARVTSPSKLFIHATDRQEAEEVKEKWAERLSGGVVDDLEVRASKAARDLADQLHVDLSRVVGTGKDGRITIEDVRSAA